MKNRVFTGSDLRKKLHRAARGSPKDSESGFRKKIFRAKNPKMAKNSNFLKKISTIITVLVYGHRHNGDQSMLVILCWWQFLDVGDEKSILVTFFEMLVTIKSVTNITRHKNTMSECW